MFPQCQNIGWKDFLKSLVGHITNGNRAALEIEKCFVSTGKSLRQAFGQILKTYSTLLFFFFFKPAKSLFRSFIHNKECFVVTLVFFFFGGGPLSLWAITVNLTEWANNSVHSFSYSISTDSCLTLFSLYEWEIIYQLPFWVGTKKILAYGPM